MAQALVWTLLFSVGLLAPLGMSESSEMAEVISQLRLLTETVTGQNAEFVSKLGEIKEDIKQEVMGMVNETMSDLHAVNGDVATLHRLLDTDECLDFSHNCSSDATCTDTRISYRCKCKPGFVGDGYTCQDVDECEEDICGPNANCINTMGSYRCRCIEGYYRNDNNTCEDIDECAKEVGCHKYAACENTPGSYKCTCAYFSEGDGMDCEVNENLQCHDSFEAIRGVGCIHIHEDEQEFDDSRESCKELGGDLFVAINPQHYFRLAQHYLDTDQADRNKYLWVGVKEGVWLSGRKVDPSEEASGNPSMKSGTCSYMDGDSGENFHLWTHPCSYDWYAVCEQRTPE
ncbi:uncharacterized protein [Palaemon carinicauda]|uniref:uncharacterized protein n=1 Tax=Palaemon carinicauda TaxID=392227 RepID=UPI0035B68366